MEDTKNGDRTLNAVVWLVGMPCLVALELLGFLYVLGLIP